MAFDTIRRYFEYRGYEVALTSTLQDANRAKEEGITPQKAALGTGSRDVTALGVNLQPATLVVDLWMTSSFCRWLDRKPSYESQGDVYFRAEKSHNYAKLANKNPRRLELGASGRTDEETARKESSRLALWKVCQTREISWDSPWGPGQ